MGSKLQLRSLPAYLIYTAVLVRAAAWYEETPPIQAAVFGLLGIYGLALISEPFLTRRLSRYPFIYLVCQSILVLALLLWEPGMDFLFTLFLPLSFQAVLFFKARLGFMWIGAFSLAMSVPLVVGWDWQLQGGVMVLLLGGLNFLMGSFANSILRADLARQESEGLLAELDRTYRQLQAYAVQLEEVAAAQERSLLARELHDSVTQSLFSMNLTVQAARMLIDKQPERVAEQLLQLQELAHQAAAEAQALVRHLQPRQICEGGLILGLQRLVDERQKRDGLQVRLEIHGSDRREELPEQLTTGLYRIVQEALNNVAKHAGSCEAVIRLDLECQPAYLEVEDQGAGFEPEKTPRSASHLGLAGMAERARELGWTWEIDSRPGRGTRIRVEEKQV